MYTTAGLHRQDCELCGQAVNRVPHDPQPQDRPVQKSSLELMASTRGLGCIGPTSLLCPLYFRLWSGGRVYGFLHSLIEENRKEGNVPTA